LKLEADGYTFPVGQKLKNKILDKNMSSRTTVASTIAAFLLLFVCSSAFAARENACSVLRRLR
jgi:hypothetical protein